MIIHNPVITGSLQVNGTSVSSIDQVDNVSGSVVSLTAASASFSTRVSGVETSVGSLNDATASYALQASISGSFTLASSSLSQRVTQTESTVAAINASTSSYLLNTTDTLTGDLTVTGRLTAQEFHTEFVSASILYDSGSTKFGNSADDTHQFTGSAFIEPGLTVTGDGSNHIIKAVRAGNTRLFVGNAVNTVGINTETVNNPLTVNGGADFSGNVGIGTTSPSAPLEVYGQGTNNHRHIYINSTETIGAGVTLQTSGSSAFSIIATGTGADQGGSKMLFYRDGVDGSGATVTIDNSGNVGIGVTTVSYPFQTANKGTTNWNSYFGTGTVRMGGGADHGSNQVLSLAPGRFGVDAPGVANGRFIVEENGRVGIGINNPTEKLTIQGTGLKFYTTQNVADQYTYIGTEYSNGNGNNKAEIRFAIDSADTRTRIQFHTAGGAGNIDERMRINYLGNVGIGTNNPSKRLTVRYDENGDPTVLKVENKNANANVGTFIGFSTGYDGYATIGAKREGAENDSSLIFSPMLNETATQRMIITSTGYVGINETVPVAPLTFGQNVSSGGFSSYGDFQVILYKDPTYYRSYGFGIESGTLMYQANGKHKFYSAGNALGIIGDEFSTLSNSNAGRHLYENKGGRLLTSNGTGWLADGRDPILTLATAGGSNDLNIAESIGLNLYTAGTTNGVHSPAIAFSNRSNSGNYETAFGIIIGKKTGQGVDSNWSAGELHFYTGKEAGYMNNVPDLRITSEGYVTNPRQPAFFVHSGPSPYTSATTAITFGTEVVDNTNAYNPANGRFTAPIAGVYYFFASALHRMSNDAGSGEISFYKNGANINSRGMGYAGGGTLDEDHDQVTISAMLSLAAGDYVTVGIYSISSGQDFYTESGLSHFGGYLIG